MHTYTYTYTQTYTHTRIKRIDMIQILINKNFREKKDFSSIGVAYSNRT
jgi:hypothetical protein